ncbi:MAG: hypothetical protein K2J81_10795, partial [Treponemataceae bacterium]|nr:hypothetical protein [Treponemataceae bacterium]
YLYKRQVSANTPDSAIYRYKAPTDQRINRMYVEYNLNGGKITFKGSGSPHSGNYYVNYWSWTKNASLIMLDDGNDVAGVKYYTGEFKNQSGTDFDAWKLTKGTAIKDVGGTETETSTSDDIVKAYTYKNAKVIASFGNKLSGSVTQEDKMVDIARDDVKFMLLQNDASTQVAGGITTDAATGISVVTKLTGGKTNNLQIQFDENKVFETGAFSDNDLYTNVRCEAWVGNYATDPIKTLAVDGTVYGRFVLSTAGYNPGDILNIMVIADTKTLKDASQTYQFVIR